MSAEKRPAFDYERRGGQALTRVDPVPWSPERERATRAAEAAWHDWLAVERERRGSQTWQPF